MGIDVRQYAMSKTDVKRAACLGCGMCAHVCPRGVLKLENTPIRWKAGQPIRVYSVDLMRCCIVYYKNKVYCVPCGAGHEHA
jgi:formate hydrogenlyase subunit 6/NADH:ubiquinone oxidoreductase subunit I